jgi:hypothetical protein
LGAPAESSSSSTPSHAGRHSRRQRGVGDRLHDLPRKRPLHGQHRVVLAAVGDLGVEAAGVLCKPGQVALVVGCVGDRQVALGLQAVGEQVVEHAAALVAQDRVLSAADRDLGDVV